MSDKVMTYTIKMMNEFNEPYIQDESEVCRHASYEEYQTYSLDLCQKIVKDFLDVPVAELTIEQIRADFEDPKAGVLPEEKLVAIQNYYNGRLALWRQLRKDLESLDHENTLRYDIPEKYNTFWVYGDDDGRSHQIQSYIEIIVKEKNR